MTLDDILLDVDLKINNAFDNKTKVMWINQVQRILYRDYSLPDKVEKFQTAANVQFYPIPADCAEDRITGVTVDNVPYEYQSGSENARERFWTMVQGQMMLYPTPDSVKDVLLYYGPRPMELSADKLTDTPTFPEDYHKLLVLGCAIECAKAMDDVAKANNFTQDYMELAAKADRDFRRQEPSFIIEVV